MADQYFDPYHQWLSIPPSEQPPNHYRLLGLPLFEDDPDVIASAADRQMTHVRSFQAGQNSDHTQRLLNEIAVARLCLLNVENKSAYDTELKTIATSSPPKPVLKTRKAQSPEIGEQPASDSASFDFASEGRSTTSRRTPTKRKPVLRPMHLAGIAGSVMVVIVLVYMLANRRPARNGQQPRAKNRLNAAVKPGETSKRTTPLASQSPPRVPEVENKPTDVARQVIDQPVFRQPGSVPTPLAPKGKKQALAVNSSANQPDQVRYLSQLQPFDVKNGPWEIVEKLRVIPGHGEFQHSVRMHPPSNGYARAKYRLAKQFSTFTTGAVIATGSTEAPPISAISFVILGDDKPLWASEPTKELERPQNCTVAVSGIDVLELRVVCPGHNERAHAFWLNPRISANIDTSTKLDEQPLVTSNQSAKHRLEQPSVVYLDDLTEEDYKVHGLARLGKHGQYGRLDRGLQPISFEGQLVEHSLTTHAIGGSVPAFVTYRLPPGYDRFETTITVVGSDRRKSAVRFAVLGDGKVLWKSERIVPGNAGPFPPCRVSIDGVRMLSLQVDCDGAAYGAWTTWINPRLSKKLPVPDPRIVDETLLSLKELYGAEYDAAKSPAAMASLARKLLQKASGEEIDPPEAFVLLGEARRLATASGDAITALEAAKRSAEEFEIDAFQVRLGTVQALNSTVRLLPQRKALAEAVFTLADAAVDRDQYEQAKALATIALDTARKLKETQLIKRIIDRRKVIEQIALAHAKIENAYTVLDAHADDPDANSTVGRFLCFVKKDWRRGLPLLAKGADAQLKAIAEKDLAEPASAEQQVDLGDAWWEVAEAMDGSEKSRIRARAAGIYFKAIPDLTGLAKDRAEQRVREASKDPEIPTTKEKIKWILASHSWICRSLHVDGRRLQQNIRFQLNGDCVDEDGKRVEGWNRWTVEGPELVIPGLPLHLQFDPRAMRFSGESENLRIILYPADKSN